MAKIIVWFRNDLRLHDHEPLLRASQKTLDILPIYCFDPRQFAPTTLGFPKTDSFRAQFILESVANLRANLQKIGSDLLIRVGKPEEVIPQIAQKWHATAVYSAKEVTDEEVKVETALETNLWKLRISINLFWTSTLYHLEDLPFSVAEDWSCCVLAGFNLAIWGGISLFSSSGDWDISCCVNANKGGNGPPPLGNAVDSSRNSSKNG